MLSGITRQNIWRKKSQVKTSINSTAPKPSLPVANIEETSDASNHGDAISPEERLHLEFLNTSLVTLVSIFPHIQPEVFRELLSNFKEESRLNLVVEALLKDTEKWVRGRWTTQENGKRAQVESELRSLTDADRLPIKAKDTFRSEQYRKVTEHVLRQEFKGIGRSVVRAVLAEHNFYYADSRAALIGLASKSWRYSFTSWISRRGKPSNWDESLVSWYHPPNGEMDVKLNLTESNELNDEIYAAIILPLRQARQEKQMSEDRALAAEINNAEAEEAGATFECQCCYVSQPFETITACSGGHFVCFSCVRHTINEALFGQGWRRSVEPFRLTLRCIASVSGEHEECRGCVSQVLLKAALLAEPDGQELWTGFEQRAAQESLSQTDLILVKCPFCPSAEVRDRPVVQTNYAWLGTILDLRLLFYMLGHMLLFGILFKLSLPVAFSAIFVALIHLITTTKIDPAKLFNTYVVKQLTQSPAPPPPEYGGRYTCVNTACARVSCLNCSEAWKDIHICHESSRLALRQHIEAAQAEAIKRTCPRCATSFIKDSGCNKLICPCGYKMCYLCRQELDARQPYGHFCPHFRAIPGQKCDKCNACELYKDEDDDEVVRVAGAKAEKEWLERDEREKATASAL